jgi:hypothetical protein
MKLYDAVQSVVDRYHGLLDDKLTRTEIKDEVMQLLHACSMDDLLVYVHGYSGYVEVNIYQVGDMLPWNGCRCDTCAKMRYQVMFMV